MLRLVRLSTAVVGLLLAAPAAASAENIFTVASCHGPQPNAAAGWVPFATGQGLTSNTCAADGVLHATLNADAPSGSSTAGWRFTAPPGTHIVRVRAARGTLGFGGAPRVEENDSAYGMQTNTQTLEECEASRSSPCTADLIAPLDKQGLNAPYVEVQVLCPNGGRPCSRRVSVNASAVSVALADPAPPVISNANIDAGENSNTLRATFDAADAGGGVYRALVKVDGKVAQAIPLAPAPCSDVNPADADPYQFDVPTPCPLAVKGAAAALDVRSLPPGPHGVEIAVEDAAGNQTTVTGPVEFPRPNVASSSPAERAAALTGRLRMWFVKAKGDRKRLTSRYGTRVVTRGLLRSRSGRGIVGARIDVYHIRRDGTRRLIKTGLKSRSRGRLTLILPNNVDTRTIEFAYRALRPGPITSRQRLRLTVRTRSGRTYYRKASGRR